MSGNTLSTIDEFIDGKVHKLVNKDRAAMPPKNVIEMASDRCNSCLMLEDKFSSLEIDENI